MPTPEDALDAAIARAGGSRPPAGSDDSALDAAVARSKARRGGTWGDTAISTGLRVVPSILGGVAGGVAASPTGPGAIAGVMAGGAAGGGVGDWLAQQYEISRGIRPEYNPWETAVETGMGAIPIKGSSTILRAAGKGAAMGAANTAAHATIAQGRMPELSELLAGSTVGGVFGGGTQGLVRGYQAVKARGQSADAAAETALAEAIERAREAANPQPNIGPASQVPAPMVARGAMTPDPRTTNGTVGRGGRFRQQHKPELSSPMPRTLTQTELLAEARQTDPATAANAGRVLSIRDIMRQRMAGQQNQQGNLLDIKRQEDKAKQQLADLAKLIGVDQTQPPKPSTPGRMTYREPRPQTLPGYPGGFSRYVERAADVETGKPPIVAPASPQGPPPAAGVSPAGKPSAPTDAGTGVGTDEPKAGALPGSTREELDANAIEISPAEYQFKSDADQKTGQTAKLRGVRAWSLLSGEQSPVLVHRRTDGRLMIVDGHQRVNLAKRLQAEGKPVPKLRATVIHEDQGYTVQDARRMGAVYNVMNDPDVKAFDVARVLRAGPLEQAEIDAIGDLKSSARTRYQQAEGLVKLSDDAFTHALQADVPPQYVALVARHFTDPQQQIDAINSLKSASRVTNVDAADSYLAKKAAAGYEDDVSDGYGGTDIFGNTTQKSMLDEVVGLEQEVARRLQGDKSAFAAAVRNKGKLEGVGGTKIDRDAAEGAAKDAGNMLAKLRAFSDKRGWTRDALMRGARDIDAGRRSNADVQSEVIAALEKDWNNVPYTGGTPPPSGGSGSGSGNGPPPPAGGGSGLFDNPVSPATGSTATGVKPPTSGQPRTGPVAATPAAPRVNQGVLDSVSNDFNEAMENGDVPDMVETMLRKGTPEEKEALALVLGDFPSEDTADHGLVQQWIRNLRGQSGAVSARLATSLAGGATGAIGGAAAPAESREERIRNAVAGGVSGLAGGAILAGAATRRRALPPGVTAPQPANQQSPGLRTTPTASGTKIRGSEEGRGQGRRVLRLGGDYDLIPEPGRIPQKQLDNLKLEKFTPGARGAIADTMKRNGGFEDQRRGVQSNPRTVELAKRLAVELDRVLPRGQAVNAEQIKAYSLALTNVSERMGGIARKVQADKAKGITNADDLLDLFRAETDQKVLLQSFIGARAESGRALQIQRQLNTLLPAEARILMAGKTGKQLQSELEKMAELLAVVKDPVEAMKIARDNMKWKPLERASSYFMANILSGIQTHERNIIGTATNVLNNLVVKGAVGAPLDLLQSTLKGRPREVYLGEVGHDIIGAVSSMDKALGDAWFTLRNGFSEEALNEMLTDMSQLRVARKELGGGLANPLNVPGRALESMDRFFVTLNRGMLTHSRAYAMARQVAERTGMKPGGKGFAEFMAKEIAEQRAGMTDAQRKAILTEAQAAAFRGDPGPLARWVMQGKQKLPALNFVIPFVSTISNMYRAGYEMTPISLAVKGARQAAGNADAFGKTARERTMTQAKGAFGSLALMPLAYLAATGRLSGAGSADRAERDQAYERGWRQNSIKVPLPDEIAASIGAERSPDGEYWIAYNLLQPLALPASVVANGFEAWSDVQKRSTKANIEQSAWDITSKMLTRVANSALSQSYFTGLFGVVDAINNPDQGAARALADLARGFTPLSGLMRNVQRAADPVVRSPRGLVENVKAGLPILSESVPASIGRFGQERTRTGGVLRRSVLVPEVEPVTADPIDLELERLGVAVGRPSDRISMTDRAGQKVQLTPDQAQQLRIARGTSTRGILELVINSPGYRRQPDSIKALMVERALSSASSRASAVARQAFLNGRPDMLDRLAQPGGR